jgi:outer membrane protein assembly factor BamB
MHKRLKPTKRDAMLSKSLLALWTYLALAALPVQADSWPFGRGDSAGTGATPSELPEKPALLWELPLGGIGFESTPIIADNTVFIGDPDGRFFAIDFATGKEKWRMALETGFVASASYIDKSIYIGDYDGVLRALDATTGKEQWSFKTEAQIDASPTAFEENLLVTSEDGTLYCLKRANGELLWKYETGDQLRCGASLAGNRTYLGGCDGKLHVVDVTQGKAIGEPIPLDGPTGSTPSVSGKNVFVPTHGGRLFAFDAATNREAWQFFDPQLAQEFQNNVATADNLVVATSRNKHVFALDATTGKIVWDVVLRKRADSSPVIAGNRVVVAAADGRLIVLDLKTGSEKWLYEIKGAFIGSPAVADGKIVVASDKGTLFCFGADLR